MEVEFSVDGEPVRSPKGITLAGALYLLGRRNFRITSREREPRSLFCGMGVCYDCVVEVDGRSNVRACQILVEQGMRVTTQDGDANLESVP